MATIDDTLAAIDADQGAALERLFALLSIPSISAVPAHFPDCERAADWLAAARLPARLVSGDGYVQCTSGWPADGGCIGIPPGGPVNNRARHPGGAR